MAGIVMACRRRTLLLLRRSTAAAPSTPLPLPFPLPAPYGVPCPVLHRRIFASSAPPHARQQLVSVLQQRQRPFASSALPPPASSASQHRLSAASPSAPPPFASDAPAGDLERRGALVLVTYLKGLFKVKLFLSLLGLLGALLGVSLMYSTFIAWNGDIPRNQSYIPHLFINRENEAKALENLMNKAGRFFLVVKGYPGCGKTSLVCDVARKRGSAVYIDSAAVHTFADLEKKVNANYQNLYLKLAHIIYRNPSSGFETFNSLSRVVKKLPGGQKLVVIVDHVHKLEPKEALLLVSWAKTSADNGSVKPVLIGSDMSKDLLDNSDAESRGSIFEIYNPKPQHVRQALQKYSKENPEESIDIEELLYLSGCFPSLLAILIDGSKPLPPHLDMQYKELWYALLIAGPNGLDAKAVPAYGNDAIFQLRELIQIDERVYYKSGLHRDAAAESLKKDSAEYMKGAFSKLYFKARKRMEEVEKAMMTRTYEAYRPSVLPPQLRLPAAAAFPSAPPSAPPPYASDRPV